MFWWSDQFILAMKQSNVCGAKGLAGKGETLKTLLSETMGRGYLFSSETSCSSTHRRGRRFPEELDAEKLHVQFCEGICNVFY